MGEKVEGTQKEATEKKVIDANDKQKKVDEGPITVVLKLDLHCDGCAKKVKKSVRYIEGVESVQADSKSNKLTVTGKVNPVHIKDRVEYKTKKKVEIISPKPKKDETDQGDKKAADKPAAAATEAKPNDQKPKEPQSTSVVLKIPLHCDGCIQKIKRIILKIDGVESVKPDGNKNLVTVTGTMNTKELVPYLKDKLKRNVDVVPPKKEEEKGAVEKKDETKVEGGEKKKDEKKPPEGNENKKEKEGDNDGEGNKKKNDVAKEADKIKSVVEKKKNDEEKVVSGESEKNKSGGEATSIGVSGDGDGSKNVNVMNKLEYYRHDPAYTYTMPPVVYNQSYHNQDYGVPVYPSTHHHGYGNEGYVNHGGYGMMMGYHHGPPPPPSPMSIHYPPAAGPSENDVFSAENPNACSIM